MKYRADIDGLRAVAVGGVVIYHAALQADLPWLHGGYTGVDVFFVISGYLISKIIAEELHAKKFSLLSFWDRRVRRIVPPLALMLVITSIFSYLILIPSEFKDFGRSVVATTTFLSNMYFRRTGNYFAGRTEDHPLLHTWSLAVEEQFYIFWPILLVVAWKVWGRRSAIIVTLGGWLVSFALSAWLISFKPEATFYYLPPRAWELLTGAVLALTPLPKPRGIIAAGSTVVGLALIAFAMVTFDVAKTPFPGPTALVPCLGAALVIYGGLAEQNVAARALGSRAMVYVGLISYGLYLWHWPVLVLGRLYAVRPLTLSEAGALVALAVALAIFSRRFVEQPTRRLPLPVVFKMPASLPAAAGAQMALGAVGAVIVLSHGIAARADVDILDLDAALQPPLGVYGKCFQNPGRLQLSMFDGCARPLPDISGYGEILVWGDSHAGAIFPAIASAAEGRADTIRYRFVSSCSPLAGVNFVNRNAPNGRLTGCSDYVEDTLADIRGNAALTHVVIVGRWVSYTEDNNINRAAQVFLTDTPLDDLTRDQTRRNLLESLERTTQAITDAGKTVVLVMPVPEYSFDAVRCYVRSRHLGRSGETCSESKQEILDHLASANSIVRTVAARNGKVKLIETIPLLCAGVACRPWDKYGLLYRDTNHLTVKGALRLRSELHEALAS